MQEHDIKLLFDAGQVAGARIIIDPDSDGWNINLLFEGDRTEQFLHAKRGGRRIFKTSDAALTWCREIGLQSVRVKLGSEAIQQATGTLKPGDKILLIEDNEDDITLTLRAFRKVTIRNEIIVKRDGQEALDYLFRDGLDTAKGLDAGRALLPSLVLLDLHLPKVDGFEVLRKIRDNRLTRLLPVVILTTSDEPEDIRQGYDLGGNSYLRKPADLNTFDELLNEVGQYWLGLNTAPPALIYR